MSGFDDGGKFVREPWPIRWRGQVVGWLVDPFPEMFNCSGSWRSAGPSGDEFLSALRSAGPDGIPVTVGGVDGVADELPAEDGGFAIQWWQCRTKRKS